MAIGMGRGSEANVPLARAVVGGLLTSTFLTLVVVPILYTLFNRDTTEAEIDIDAELTGEASHQAPSLVAAAPTGNGDLAVAITARPHIQLEIDPSREGDT